MIDRRSVRQVLGGGTGKPTPPPRTHPEIAQRRAWNLVPTQTQGLFPMQQIMPRVGPRVHGEGAREGGVLRQVDKPKRWLDPRWYFGVRAFFYIEVYFHPPTGDVRYLFQRRFPQNDQCAF